MMRRTIAFLLGAASYCTGEAIVVESIAAKVNGEIITRSEIGGIAGRLKGRIDDMLLLQKGKEMGISVDNEVSRWLAQMQVRARIVDPAEFQAALQKETSVPFEDYRSRLHDYLLRERVLRELVMRDIVVSRGEIQQYYEQHKGEFVRTDQVFLREIFLSTERKNSVEIASIEQKARNLAARAKSGERFTDLARQYSESSSKSADGYLGGFQRSELDNHVEMAVWEQERGFITEPIQRTAPRGFLILRVEERHEVGQASLEQVEDEIRERLYVQRFQPAVRALLTRLRQEAFLEIRPEYGDGSVSPTAWTNPAPLRAETVTKEEIERRTRRRRLFRVIPIPGTATNEGEVHGTSTSR